MPSGKSDEQENETETGQAQIGTRPKAECPEVKGQLAASRQAVAKEEETAGGLAKVALC
jgi:hypothetical protein